MMKPLLLVSAIALAAPVLAQSTTNTGTTGTTTNTGSMSQGMTGTSPGTTTTDDTGAARGNMTNSQSTTQIPAGDDDDAVDHSAMGHGTTGTNTGTTDTGTMTGTGTNGTTSGTGMSQGTMGTSGAAGQTTAANWNNSSGGMTIQPGNTNPERDARGIAVISAPAMAPAGWNGSGGTAMGGPLVEPGAGEAGGQNYPACSRTVTDNCLQTYERGRSR